jgi:hypothetical protein
MMLPAIALVSSLFVAPPGSDASSKLDAALEQVGAEEPATTIASVEDALADAAKQPGFGDDEATRAKLLEARLALAWLYLANSNAAGADAAMDEALRSARGRKLDPGKFGPAILELHDKRKAALASRGTATIEVDRKVPCTIFIDEQPAENPTEGLLLGRYRVWVSASEGDPLWEFHELELASDGAREQLSFEGPTPITVPVATPVDAPKPKRKRAMPRWAEILGMTVGGGLIAGGAVLLSYNGKCRDGGDPTSCQFIWDNTIQGASLLAAGGVVFASFGATLVVDEVRVGRAKGKQAMLTWSFRF